MAITKIDSSMLEDVSGADNLVKLDANAKIPACSGASLSVKPGPIKNASDPAIDSNKSLGAEWLNTTDGEMFICTDATAGANVWTNVGAGTGDIVPYSYQGTTYGFSIGGHLDYNSIHKYSFTSDANSIDHGDQVGSSYGHSSTQSSTHGYSCSHTDWGGTPAYDRIEKFALASNANATDIANTISATSPQQNYTAHSDGNHGYLAGGWNQAASPQVVMNVVQRFSMSTDADSVDVGDLYRIQQAGFGWSSSTKAYQAAGYNGNNIADITNFTYSSSVSSADCGNLTVVRRQGKGGQACNSTTEGFGMGGWVTGASDISNVIDKMSFATEADAVDHGDLHTGVGFTSHSSSTTYGYCAGGQTAPSATKINNIQKFAFASNTTGSDVGDMTITSGNDSGSTVSNHSGCQY